MGAKKREEPAGSPEPAAAEERPPFEVCLSDLEQIVRQLEDGHT